MEEKIFKIEPTKIQVGPDNFTSAEEETENEET